MLPVQIGRVERFPPVFLAEFVLPVFRRAMIAIQPCRAASPVEFWFCDLPAEIQDHRVPNAETDLIGNPPVKACPARVLYVLGPTVFLSWAADCASDTALLPSV
jgi:hypothetical protein